MAEGNSGILQFVPFSSAIEIGFWHKLTKNKLEKYKLDDSSQTLHGSFVNNDPNGLPCRMNVDYTAFEESAKTHVPRLFQSPGEIVIKNTVDDFKSCDKKKLIDDVAKQIYSDILSGAIDKEPSLLNRFVLLTFADLKKYHFYYWFAFPALSLKENFNASSILQISDVYNSAELDSFKSAYDSLNGRIGHDPSVFLLKKNGESFVAGSLDEWNQFFDEASEEVTVAFSDPSTFPRHPGWPLRNLLTYLALTKKVTGKKLKIICYRDRIRDSRREIEHSLVLTIDKLSDLNIQKEDVSATGWEKNQKDKMGPRMVNLSSTMDPVKLAESAADLNLKLMKWRLVPDLDLEKIATTKCLLLGSGTLGCNVARSLLGWGVRTITFVDNSKVSYSNPCRQTLFQFEDCLNGGKPKAAAAAEAMKRIFPGVICASHDLSIPMPGHAISPKDEEKVKKDVEYLENLINQHDAIFLLMDTRESRWLPTVMAASKGKMLINAALGFDTFMVMRHGYRKNVVSGDTEKPQTTAKTVRIPGEQLGCYYCNDVVAPGDSTQDRTLDQQCTVSRPGISMMASALAVELLVSILQHPLGMSAPAETSANENHLQAEFETPIGIIPHQIRCFLSRFNTVLPATCAFDKCTACSKPVIEAFEKDGFEFLKKVFNVPKFLEDMVGLTALHASINYDDVDELSDSSDECDDVAGDGNTT